MSESRIVKEFRLGGALVSVIDTDSYDPATQYDITITGPFPTGFTGLPRSLMLRVIRALALMARQSAAGVSKDINQWATTIPGSGRELPRAAKGAVTAKSAVTPSPASKAGAGSASSASREKP